MHKRKFTVFTQLHEENNADLIEYVDDRRKRQSKIMRKTFHAIKNSDKFNKSSYNTYLQNEYGIMKRTAGSIISDAQGRLNALRELKVYEKRQLEQKIEHLEKKVLPKLVLKLNDYIVQLNNKQNVSLVRLRNLRHKIVSKKNKLNQLKQKLDNVTYQIESGRLKLCFGTKYLLKRDYKRFVAQRDSQMSFVGSKSETAQNNMLQLSYNSIFNCEKTLVNLKMPMTKTNTFTDAFISDIINLNWFRFCVKAIVLLVTRLLKSAIVFIYIVPLRFMSKTMTS